MPRLRLLRWFLAYTAFSGISLAAVLLYDFSMIQTTRSSSPWALAWVSNQLDTHPLFHVSSRVVPALSEHFSFCSVDPSDENRPSSKAYRAVQDDKARPRSSSSSARADWPPSSFDPNLSTEENYSISLAAPRDEQHLSQHLVGKFAQARAHLDYSYHRVYTPPRQELQDSILASMLGKSQLTCPQKADEQWVVFSAGVMGSGKTHTIQWMAEQDLFPLQYFAVADPDNIRNCLPEFDFLVQHDATKAGDRTRKEAGMMSEILTLAALEGGQSVIVDGSLRDADWYDQYFLYLRQHFPQVQIAIFHVTAPRETILQRAESRARITGRVVPVSLLERAMIQVPNSIERLKAKADFFVELNNAGGDVQPVNMDWDAFSQQWGHLCNTA